MILDRARNLDIAFAQFLIATARADLVEKRLHTRLFLRPNLRFF